MLLHRDTPGTYANLSVNVAHIALTTAPNRVNWSGAALSAFYSAVRQALVVAIIFRALAATVGLAAAGWWLSKWLS